MKQDVEKGFYHCIRCGDYMLTMLWTDHTGRVIYKLEPIGCENCDSSLTITLNFMKLHWFGRIFF